jgi:hypothetical protein
MSTIWSYVKRHHLGLLALLLVLTGGTAYAANAIPKNAVASKQIKNDSVKGKDVKDGGLTGGDLADGSVGGADVADGSVGGVDLADGGVGAADLATGSVDGARIKDGSVGEADIADGVVPQVVTKTTVVPLDGGGPWLNYTTIPGVGSIEFICSTPSNAGARIMAVGGGTEVYSFVEGQDLTTGQGAVMVQKGPNAYIVQAQVTSALIASRIIAHSATKSIDVDVRVSTYNNKCTITGTTTVTDNVTGTLPG